MIQVFHCPSMDGTGIQIPECPGGGEWVNISTDAAVVGSVTADQLVSSFATGFAFFAFPFAVILTIRLVCRLILDAS